MERENLKYKIKIASYLKSRKATEIFGNNIKAYDYMCEQYG